MTTGPTRLWPHETRHALFAAFLAFVAFFALLLIAHLAFDFPETLESGTVYALLLISLAPVALVLADALVGRGATIEYMGVKLALAGTAAGSPASVSVPTNIGVAAQAVTDSSTGQILDALRAAISKDVVIIDLESGKAWWATRLLVLVAGAVRYGRPAGIVFVATVGGVSNRFQGWGDPKELLPALLDANPAYRLCYERAKAAAAQWSMVEPIAGGADSQVQPWMSGLATRHSWMAFEPSGLPNPFILEQFLANELGSEVETHPEGEWVSAARLRTLFLPVLHEELIDEPDPDAAKVARLLEAPGRYITITRDGVYQRLVSKDAGLAALVHLLVKPRQVSAS